MSRTHTPLVVAVSGVKNSGKTTLIEGMLPLLSHAGLRVAVVKHDGHAFQPDVPGTDSHRCRAAGAMGVAVYDGKKSMVIRAGTVTESHLIAQFGDAHLVLLEGFKHSFWPKLELIRGSVSTAPVCDPSTLLALVSDLPLSLPGIPTLPLAPDAAAAFLLRYYHTWRGSPAPPEPLPPPASPSAPLRAAVYRVSDACYSGEETDSVGPLAAQALRDYGLSVVCTLPLPNDRAILVHRISPLCDRVQADLVLTLGGEGVSPWDCAPEALSDLAERHAPGLSLAIRQQYVSLGISPLFTRCEAGIRGRTLIVNLPDAPDYLTRALPSLLPRLLDGVSQLKSPK